MSWRFSSVLGAIAKDEGPYLEEWADHHLSLGFDRIHIYANEGAVTRAYAPLRRAPFARRVWITPWRLRRRPPQVPAYADCLSRYRRRAEWLMFLDLDEFLNLKAHPTLAAFMAEHASADAVAVHWRMFGSSGQEAPDGRPVLQRFTRAAPAAFGPNAHVKTIFRPRAALRPGVHVPELKPAARLVDTLGRPLAPGLDSLHHEITLERAQVNHYFTRSRAEFMQKRARGRADVRDGDPVKHRAASEFEAYDRNEEEDLTILR